MRRMRRNLITKKEIVAKRKNLYQLAEKYHDFNKGDKRVHTPRLCVVCSRPLSSLVIKEGKYITSVSHVHFHLNEYFKVDICKDVASCYRTLAKKGELINVDGG
ncbi:hypothetical protein HWC53_gp048 [Bacillus phage vB_BmeM-Goe8]|uniref:Uncharacterized protein n=1 Tax=Bacillus phage vB_BmeM-Goe8 TaxID=2593638 RepID=A0A516KML8_9CAUD|nr:hypothetical protein HWC53_gp048 [Bacillus phage vB_BmeM-Goe8]QDP42832.1 hypothetical protein Goe8_c00480 [Bacillus phage vB_BmeM-Goe8]